MNCPRCQQAELAFDRSIGALRCPHCDYRPPAAQPSTLAADLSSRAPIRFTPPPGLDMDDLPAHLNDYEQVRLRSRLHSAMWALARGNPVEIRRALDSILEITEDHADTWWHLAAMAPDAAEQRRCLEHIAACRPGDPQAIRLLAELDGKLAPEPLPAQPHSLEPGQVAARRITCPHCGGTLTYNPAEREVMCKFCGKRIVDADDLQRTATQDTVIVGNLRRQRQPRPWNVGAKWVRCASCGAVTTLSRATLSRTCRFCQSQQVIVESANHRFEQPDLIVPFALSEADARDAVTTHLRSGIRWLTRFFADAVERIDLGALYLPFWVFDADMVVNWSWTNAEAHGQNPVLLSDVPYLAAATPAAKVFEKLEPFDLRRGVDYDPRLVAAHPAQLYDIDLPEASIKVRQRLTRDACRQAAPGLQARRPAGRNRDDSPGSLRLNAYTQFLTYRLALLPVWMGRLVEEDDDTRQVLVNGQTGRVALGALRRAGR